MGPVELERERHDVRLGIRPDGSEAGKRLGAQVRDLLVDEGHARILAALPG
jgi:hypothetical protein